MEKTLPYFKRMYIYQKERFPVVAHGTLITAFTFSAIAYSRICRGQDGFIPIHDFVIGIIMSFSLFLLLRICDEFKDREDDLKYRPYLPVPRGLVTLKELKNVGIAIVCLQASLLMFFQPQMIPLYSLVLIYLFLMTKEFFIESWIRDRQLIYIFSHMMIIPLIDLYSSGLDWHLEGVGLHKGIGLFVLVSFLNGLVLEIGRKIRSEEGEEDGVVSYTKLYGRQRATYIWIALMCMTLTISLFAGIYADFQLKALTFLVLLASICIFPALRFIKNPTCKYANQIEKMSGLWTVLMYLSLVAIPMIKNLCA